MHELEILHIPVASCGEDNFNVWNALLVELGDDARVFNEFSKSRKSKLRFSQMIMNLYRMYYYRFCCNVSLVLHFLRLLLWISNDLIVYRRRRGPAVLFIWEISTRLAVYSDIWLLIFLYSFTYNWEFHLKEVLRTRSNPSAWWVSDWVKFLDFLVMGVQQKTLILNKMY